MIDLLWAPTTTCGSDHAGVPIASAIGGRSVAFLDDRRTPRPLRLGRSIDPGDAAGVTFDISAAVFAAGSSHLQAADLIERFLFHR
jgi:hypothetical protein